MKPAFFQPLTRNVGLDKKTEYVPQILPNEIVHGNRRITAETALRLAHYFKISPQFWFGLQMDYDLDVEEDRLADRISEEVKTYKAA